MNKLIYICMVGVFSSCSNMSVTQTSIEKVKTVDSFSGLKGEWILVDPKGGKTLIPELLPTKEVGVYLLKEEGKQLFLEVRSKENLLFMRDSVAKPIRSNYNVYIYKRYSDDVFFLLNPFPTKIGNSKILDLDKVEEKLDGVQFDIEKEDCWILIRKKDRNTQP